MDEPRNYHMSPEELRRWGRALVDWIADYQERVESFPVLSRAEPGSIRAALPPAPPERGEPFDAILADVERIILPGITHWQSPRFHAYFPSNASGPSILGELLSAGLGIQGMLWTTSPACTELETHVLDWLVPALGLPESFLSSGSGGGVIQDTASSAVLCALLAARERATGFAAGERGLAAAARESGGPEDGGGELVAYASSQAHSSVEKAVRIAGLGRRNLRLVEVDESYAMRPEALARRMEEDVAAGRVPSFVCATVGTTASTAVDPVAEIARICRRYRAWLHVDAAMCGAAAICPEMRWIHDGVELADSYCFNPHKWLFTNLDCDCFWVADREALIRTLTVLPDYLRNRASESGEVIDYRDWHIPLGRRFRALKLWFVLRHYGLEGLRHHLRRHLELARRFASRMEEDPRFELAAPVRFNLVCFRHRDGDAANQALIDRLNAGGALFLSHARLDGRLTLRFCAGQTWTELRHVEAAWREIRAVADTLAA